MHIVVRSLVIVAAIIANYSASSEGNDKVTERALKIYLSCVVASTTEFARGPDSAEFILKAALLTCQVERAAFISLFTASHLNDIEFINQSNRMLDNFADQEITLTIAKLRAKRSN